MRVLAPRDLPELFEALAQPGAKIMAGGTDLLVRLRQADQRGEPRPETLVRLGGISALHGVERRPCGALGLGAACTHAELLAHPLVRSELPELCAALCELGSPPIRNMGTLGGNICTASPAGDALPPLLALGAEVELASASGLRRVPLSEFITGPGRTRLAPGEVLTAVRARPTQGFQIRRFEKVGRRGALAVAVVSLAALVRLERGRVAEARLAWGSVGPTVWRCPEAETALVGERLGLSALTRAAKIVSHEVKPIDDSRASADYRRQVAGNLLLRLAVL
ncbi:xanthine dehydrogenase FAD-binding subunit [Humidesulfovibrio mexicanus]|jgi:xanthine dehydrogenase FAD-binding subunit|uniref:Xanthine dehydrogenase FAD-binding subunit n=1 Tax=Humidesulfovibrio mexicanus TaxID=147047 RepID=A0A238YYD3_9BACT|nr:xanthine dehydrogenase family protein subunit M [Humidesulfovibrio mexicanus]SNR75761.1 xanthine dehydrogenase FAD-binding subunit [Humidesulfovibrio mexicanus]